MRNKKIMLIVLFCVALLTARIVHTERLSFVFLLWNLFLAWLPLIFARRIREGNNKYVNAGIAAVCILFLPNSPYILTDLFHLGEVMRVPLWLDLILLLSFALAGMYYFFVSVDHLLKWMSWHQSSKRFIYIGKVIIMMLSAYGVYLGRYLRFNSWDVVADPYHLATRMYHSVFDPANTKDTLSMTLTFGVFLFLMYEMYEVAGRKERAHEEKN